MAYRIRQHSSMQSAVKAAALVVSAMTSAGILSDEGEVDAAFEKVTKREFDRLHAIALEDNKTIEAEEEKEAATRSTRSTSSGGSRSSGGGKSGGGGRKKKFSVKEAGEVRVSFGAFGPDKEDPDSVGLTIAEIFATDERRASRDFGYEKSGKQWLEWAQENATSGYLRDAIETYVDGVKNGEAE